MDEPRLNDLAQKIWDYHHLNQPLEKADAIFVLGSHDTRVAEYAVDLFLAAWAPLLICSGTSAGHKNDLLATDWDKSEAELFAEIAVSRGVPAEKILIEKEATNTGDNIKFTKILIEQKALIIKKLILVQKPYMERRTYATFKKVWPEMDFVVTSPQIPFDVYPNEHVSKDGVINIMIGDLQRIKEYPAKGFQIAQEIPEDVWIAYEELVRAGYDKHLIKA